MVRRGASGLGVRRMALRPRTVVPDTVPGGHHPTASRGAYPRLADQCLTDGARTWCNRASAAAVAAQRGVSDHRHGHTRCGHLQVLIGVLSTCRARLSPDQANLPDENPCFFVYSPESSRVLKFMPGQTSPRKIWRASGVGGLRHRNSVVSTRPPGRQTRTSSLAARGRSTNIVTASARTRSKRLSAKESSRISTCRSAASGAWACVESLRPPCTARRLQQLVRPSNAREFQTGPLLGRQTVYPVHERRKSAL